MLYGLVKDPAIFCGQKVVKMGLPHLQTQSLISQVLWSGSALRVLLGYDAECVCFLVLMGYDADAVCMFLLLLGQ